MSNKEQAQKHFKDHKPKVSGKFLLTEQPEPQHSEHKPWCVSKWKKPEFPCNCQPTGEANLSGGEGNHEQRASSNAQSAAIGHETPPSQPTGEAQEITEKVKDFCEKHGLREHFIGQDLQRMINAALANERTRLGQAFDDMVKDYEMKLAAERDYAGKRRDEIYEHWKQELMDTKGKFESITLAANTQTLAEREKKNETLFALAEAIQTQNVFKSQLVAEREKNKPLLDALKWLDEFVIEPEYFPGDGDRQWWREKRQSIAAIAKTTERKA